MKTNHEIETLNSKSSAWLAFHDDEGGMETMQIVMIIAVAAIVLLTVRSFWDEIKGWAQGLVSGTTSWTS